MAEVLRRNRDGLSGKLGLLMGLEREGEGGREGGWEGGREGGTEGGRKVEREGGRERGREVGKRECGREGEGIEQYTHVTTKFPARYLRSSLLLRNLVLMSTVIRHLGLAMFVTDTSTFLALESYIYTKYGREHCFNQLPQQQK